MRFSLRRLFEVVAVIAIALALLMSLTTDYRKRLAIRSDLQRMGAYYVHISDSNSFSASFHVPVSSPDIAKYRGQLKGLDFRKAHVTDESLKNISGLENVGIVIFSWSDVRDDQLRLLKNFRKVRVLWLSHTQLTDACVDAILEVPGLEIVRVNGSRITERGIERLKKARESLTVQTQ